MAAPSIHALRDICWKLIRRGLRIGPGFLSRRGVEGGDTGKIFRAFRDLQVDWRAAAYQLQENTTLSTTDPDAIARWGRDLSVPKLPGESALEWGARIRSQIQVETSTLGAVEAAVQRAFGVSVEVREPFELQGEASVNATRSGTARSTSRYYTGGALEINSWRYLPQIYPIVRNIKGGGVKPYYVFRFERVDLPLATVAGVSAHDRAMTFFQSEAYVALRNGEDLVGVQVPYRKYFVKEIPAAEYFADAAQKTPRYPNLPGCRIASLIIRTPDYADVEPPNADSLRYFKVVDPAEVAALQPTKVYFEAAFDGDCHLVGEEPEGPQRFDAVEVGIGLSRAPGVSASRVTLGAAQVDLAGATVLARETLDPVFRYPIQTEVFAQVLDFA